MAALMFKTYLRHFYLLLYMFFVNFFFEDSFSQEYNSKVRIDTIIITGTKVTKNEVIFNEIDFKIGDSITIDKLSFYRERIYSLEIFNRVDLNLNKNELKNELNINVEESWYYLFLPYAILRKNSLSKSSFGLYLNKKNFRGLNEKLKFVFALGYDPYYQFQYYSPNFFAKDYFAYFELNYSIKENKSEEITALLENKNFSYKNLSFAFFGGKRFGTFVKASLGFSYEMMTVPNFAREIFFIENNKKENLYTIATIIAYDDRDLSFMPETGKLLDAKIEAKKINFGDKNYILYSLDFRNYNKIIRQISSKQRVYYKSTIGKIKPYYSKSYLGYDQKVRGHYFENKEGDDLGLLSIEVKYPLIKEMNIKFNFPLAPEALTSYRTALYFYLFSDAGFSKKSNQKIVLKNFDSGYGAGLAILIMPYQALRCEFAFNEKRRGEIIVELGFSF